MEAYVVVEVRHVCESNGDVLLQSVTCVIAKERVVVLLHSEQDASATENGSQSSGREMERELMHLRDFLGLMEEDDGKENLGLSKKEVAYCREEEAENLSIVNLVLHDGLRTWGKEAGSSRRIGNEIKGFHNAESACTDDSGSVESYGSQKSIDYHSRNRKRTVGNTARRTWQIRIGV